MAETPDRAAAALKHLRQIAYPEPVPWHSQNTAHLRAEDCRALLSYIDALACARPANHLPRLADATLNALSDCWYWLWRARGGRA